MKEFKKQLKLISRSLVTLSEQISQMAECLDKLPLSKDISTTEKKTLDRKNSKKQASGAPVIMKSSMLGVVFNGIKNSRNGITIPELRKKTGLAPKQLSNALFKLTNKGKIKPLSRGVYIKT